jgi:transglutaminase-like putative cysteine protease
MSIHVALRHVTEYRYDRLVTLSPQQVRLRPAPHCRTRILSYSQRVTPATHFINWQQDPQGNYVARLTFPDQVREFRVEVDLVAEMAVYNPFDFFLGAACRAVSLRLRRGSAPGTPAVPRRRTAHAAFSWTTCARWTDGRDARWTFSST